MKRVQPTLCRRILIPALPPLALLVLLNGCHFFKPESPPPSPTPSETKLSQDATPAPKAPPLPSIPPSLLTQGLRLMGAPFTEEIVYEVEGLEPAKKLQGSRQTTEVKIEGNAVRFVQSWTGDLRGLGSAEYLSNKEGVSTLKILNQTVEPPALTLPASLSEGKKWEASYTIPQMPNFGKTRVWQRFKVLKQETITVPLGTLKTWVVEMESTLTGERIRATVKGTSWLAEGIGEVKSEFKREIITAGENEVHYINLIAVGKKPLSSTDEKKSQPKEEQP
jgi:hypothetical protein